MPERKCVSHKVLVGMEIHVQLATRSKMFTSVANASGSLRVGEVPPEPNSAVDPVILGLPGVLPVINKRAVEYSIMAGLAMGCEIAKYTKWDRKSYYYPDLPKNYQISQYDLPLCGPGTFEIEDSEGKLLPVRIRRAHLEEDAGKLLHEAPGGYAIDGSIVDLNRAGTPLLEIVTEPDLHTPADVARFGQELQKLVQFLGISEGQMQLGHMRFEPNINVHITDSEGKVWKTAITEIKNLNSFNVLEKATAYEVQRQIRQWEATGDLGRKSTYGWDDQTETTFMQRTKEEADDYRYFADPDLVAVEVDEKWLTELKGQIGELPRARRQKYEKMPGLREADARRMASTKQISDSFEAMIASGADPRRAANLIESLLETDGTGGERIRELQMEAFEERDSDSGLANENSMPPVDFHPSEVPSKRTQARTPGEERARIKPVGKVRNPELADRRGASPIPRLRETPGEFLTNLTKMMADGKIAANKDVAKAIFNAWYAEPFATSLELVTKLGLIQSTDTGAVDAAIDAVLATNPPALADFRAGKQSAIGALVGMTMKQAKGLNAKVVQERLRAKIGV